ncbi:MAG: hypothetical protein NZT92_12115 [Abditibacteriales bacterium]|nr:hypothetical protein [Abditibacteriales bacterium]MDW8365285.1 type III-B CRISPR module-associated Cmr3 family protein [Abditibacteriales bacterium]
MTRLLITIKTLSPLYAGALKPYGSFLETRGEISGALLRGAVASRTLRDCAAPELINNHEACGVKDICPFYYLTTGVAFPTCAVADLTRPTEPPLRTMVTCNAPLEPFGKRYVNEGGGRYHSASMPRTRRMTHVGINRRRETAEQGLLYSVQAVVEGTQFIGCMAAPDSWDERRVDEFKQLLESITRLGGEQTYGLGRVEIELKEADGDEEDVPTRVGEFNKKLKEVWSNYGGENAPQGDYFTIDLLTPALLTTPDGTPTVQLTADMLQARAAELGFANLRVEQVCCPDDAGVARPLMFTAPITVAGWSEAWGLPKPPALAATAGSVYVFRTDDISAWHDALTQIEAHGIGARREEGFGAVRVCDPFHREVEPQ